MLDFVVAIGKSDAAHLYRADPATFELRLIGASPALEDSRIPRASLRLSGMVKACVFRAGDPGFDNFPVTLVSPFASLLAVPIRGKEQLAGMLTLCRKDSRSYEPHEMEAAGKAGELLREVDALHARLRSARQENLLLEKRMAERKLMERAKGLLQSHYGWTEEDAYYHLRRTSRQQRTPLAVIAQQVIDVVAAKEVKQERMSA